MYKLIHNNSCSKSRRCKSILDSKKINYEIIEYKKLELSKNQIKDIVEKLKQSPQEIIRKNEKEFKINNFNINDKDEVIEFLFNYPNCIQRPLFFDGNQYIICRPPEEVLLHI